MGYSSGRTRIKIYIDMKLSCTGPENLPFNPSPPLVMHIDLNSCFATIEQQANPLLRGKPVAVAAYTTPNGCIIAPSVEAKTLGIKVGMRVRDGKKICPPLVVLPPDPWKYRFINRKLLALLRRYRSPVFVKSIDEMVVDFSKSVEEPISITCLAGDIKRGIKEEIGSWLRVSIGIAPNRFLAKVASGLHKPDGLDEIRRDNFRMVFDSMPVEKLCGIKLCNTARLNSVGIHTAYDMYRASLPVLKSAFQSVNACWWYLRIKGYETDDVEFGRRSFGQSYALYQATGETARLKKILCKLVEKMGRRMRNAGFSASGIHLGLLFSDYSFWHKGQGLGKYLYNSRDLYKEALRIMTICPEIKPVRIMAVSCFRLKKDAACQLSFFSSEEKKRNLTKAQDSINNHFGPFTVFPGVMTDSSSLVPDRIAFGGIRELEEFLFREPVTGEVYSETASEA